MLPDISSLALSAEAWSNSDDVMKDSLLDPGEAPLQTQSFIQQHALWFSEGRKPYYCNEWGVFMEPRYSNCASVKEMFSSSSAL